MPRSRKQFQVPRRQRKMKNAMKNAVLTQEETSKKILAWHQQVAKDFEEVFGDEVWLIVSNAIYIRTAEAEGVGTLSWIGNVPNTIDMIGHLIRQLAKDGVNKGGMTPEEAGRTLMAEVVKVAGLAQLETVIKALEAREKKLAAALRECAKSPGSSRRICHQTLDGNE